MMTLSRFGSVVTPDKVGADVNLKFAPVGRPAGGGDVAPLEELLEPPEELLEELLDEPPDELLDEPPEELLEELLDEPPDEPLEELLDEPPDELLEELLDEPLDELLEELLLVLLVSLPVAGSVELVVVFTPSQPARTPRQTATRQPRTEARLGRYSNI